MTRASTPDDTERRYAFYRGAMAALDQGGVPFLVGGGFALEHYTGTRRDTKDMDLFVRPRDFEKALLALDAGGFRTEVTFTHWIGKALGREDEVVDVIFSSGNGVCRVDDRWFEHALERDVLGYTAQVAPAEEMIWQKAFILGRCRSDVADVAHLIQRWGHRMDWDRLVERFGEHWPVLLAQLVLYTFIFPLERDRVPARVLDDLLARFDVYRRDHDGEAVCHGTILSIQQFAEDVRQGYRDGRLPPHGSMSQEQIERWMEAFD